MMSTVAEDKAAERRSLKVEVNPEFRRRIKVRAAETGVTMRQYILEALEHGLAEDEAHNGGGEA